MSYDVNRLRGVHPPACTCVECTRRRNRGRRRQGEGSGGRGRGSGSGGGGSGNGSGGGRRLGCLPFVMALAGAGALSALLVALA